MPHPSAVCGQLGDVLPYGVRVLRPPERIYVFWKTRYYTGLSSIRDIKTKGLCSLVSSAL